MNKKPVVFFAACDAHNFQYAVPFFKSMVKFHDPKQIAMLLYTTVQDKALLAKLPKGIQVVSLTEYLKDANFFYRQKPVLMDTLLNEYELAVGFDVDQLVLGTLDYIIDTKDYDVGTVINWNRADPQVFGFVELSRIGILPAEYFNCGLVAARSKKFVHEWLVACFSPQFERMQYREQDILNILCYFGNFNVRCFDLPDAQANHRSWYGIISKGELSKAIVSGNEIIIPKGEGDTPFPPDTMTIRIVHMGGGNGQPKDNWARYFPHAVWEKIQKLLE